MNREYLWMLFDNLFYNPDDRIQLPYLLLISIILVTRLISFLKKARELNVLNVTQEDYHFSAIEISVSRLIYNKRKTKSQMVMYLTEIRIKRTANFKLRT